MVTKDFQLTVGGTVSPSAQTYIERPADKDLFEACSAMEYSYVLAPRQIGKSSLVARVAVDLAAQGYNTAIVDLNSVGVEVTNEEWYSGVLREICRDLGLVDNLVEWWGQQLEPMSMAQSFIGFVREVLLPRVDGNTVIFIDEIDLTLSLSFTDDFFAAIRTLYNNRVKYDDLSRLAFVLIGVVTPDKLIKDPNRTPYNIGHPIDIRDFTLDECEPFKSVLSKRFAPGRASAFFDRIFFWSNGHPFITQSLCEKLEEFHPSLDPAVSSESIVDSQVGSVLNPASQREADVIGYHLLVIDSRIRADDRFAEMLRVYERVLKGKPVADDKASSVERLKVHGFVVQQGEGLRTRNRIYERKFDKAWVNEVRPPDHSKTALKLFLSMLAVVATIVYLTNVRYPQIGRILLFGENYKEVHDLGQTIPDLTTLLSIFPNSSKGYYYRGIAYFWNADYENALDDLDKAIELVADYAPAYRARGRVFEVQEDFESAISQYDQALAIDPEYSRAYFSRGTSFLRKEGGLERAEADLLKAIETEVLPIGDWPYTLARAYTKLGFAYQRAGEHDSAITQLNKAIELDRELAEAYLHRGESLRIQGLEEEAASDFIRVALLDPDVLTAYDRLRQLSDPDVTIDSLTTIVEQAEDNEWAYRARAEVLFEQGNLEGAIADYTTLVEMVPAKSRAWYYFARGEVYQSIGETDLSYFDYARAVQLQSTYLGLLADASEDPQGALAIYTRLIEELPNKPEPYVYRGEVYVGIGNYQKAIEDFEAALRIGSSSQMAYEGRAQAYTEMGYLEAALQDYDRLIQLNSSNYEARRLRARLQERLGAIDAAIKDYDEIISRISSSTNPSPFQLAQDYHARAQLLIHDNEVDKALEDLNRALALAPDTGFYYVTRGGIFSSLDRSADAIADYTTALELSPGNRDALLRRGDEYMKLQQYDSAIRDFTAVQSIDVNGSIYEHLVVEGDMSQTLTNIDLFISSNPANSFGYYYKGRALIESGEAEEGVEYLYDAIDISPAVEAFYSLLGQGGSPSSISENFDRLIGRFPQNPYAYFHRGNHYRQLGDAILAIEDYSKAVDLLPTEAQFFVTRGELYAAQGDHEAAVLDFAQGLNFRPRDAHWHRLWADSQRALGRLQLAVDGYSEALSLDRRSVTLLALRGETYVELGETALALEDFGQILLLDPENVSAYVRHGELQMAAQNAEGAIEDFSRAIELEPGNAHYYRLRGDALSQLNRNTEALVDYRRGQDLDPGSATLFHLSGDTNRRLGNLEDAMEDYSRAIQLAPDLEWVYLAHVARAELLASAGRTQEAINDYERALQLVGLESETRENIENALRELR